MADKKAEGRFTIGFNLADPTHRAVADLLNQQGRRKAQFIVNAIQHYIHCPETPEIPQPAATSLDSRLIEEIVLRILKQQSGLTKNEAVSAKSEAPTKDGPVGGMENLLGKEGLSTIANTLAAFRKG